MKLSGAMTLLIAMLAFSSSVLADSGTKSKDRADVTIAVMKNGETPHDFLHKIQLPQAENIVNVGFDKHVDGKLHGAMGEINDAGEAASEAATQSIKDSQSVDGKQSAPEDTVHQLQPDQPLINK